MRSSLGRCHRSKALTMTCLKCDKTPWMTVVVISLLIFLHFCFGVKLIWPYRCCPLNRSMHVPWCTHLHSVTDFARIIKKTLQNLSTTVFSVIFIIYFEENFTICISFPHLWHLSIYYASQKAVISSESQEYIKDHKYCWIRVYIIMHRKTSM